MAHAPLTSLWKLLLYAGFTLVLLPAQIFALRFHRGWARQLPIFYHRICARLLGFRITIEGERSAARPTLFVVNHSSYLDITLLGAALEASFIAKSEVARWPVYGVLAKLQNTVFVERNRSRVAGQRDHIAERLATGDSLILFPEGTSNDGNRTLPFKSALFEVADIEIGGQKLAVQPVSLAYTRLNGIAIGRTFRPFFAWYGDMDLAPHLWRVLGLGVIEVEIRFHPVVTLAQLGSRKALASYCQNAVAKGVSDSLAGRAPIVPPPATREATAQPAQSAIASG
jgi:1-acyl-sn-glycerol-3-phosphate acyltransferase